MSAGPLRARPPAPGSAADVAAVASVERAVARLLAVGAVVAVVLLATGVVLMIGEGVDPTGPTFPVFDAAAIVDDLLALRPEGFLWAGLLVVIATPIVRVVGELVGFAWLGDRPMVLVAGAILVVVAASVVLALAFGGGG